jgi:hypothetical protein
MDWKWELRELALYVALLFSSTVALGAGVICVLWIAKQLGS